MSRYGVSSGAKRKAQKTVVYGVDGIGKTTFASLFPSPLFIDTEGSTVNMNVNRACNPLDENGKERNKTPNWEVLIDQVRDVIESRHCKTLVVDTADWAENLLFENVRAKTGGKSLNAGYNQGWSMAQAEWGRFLNLLQDVVDVANINVVLVCHAALRRYEQPDEIGSYDKFELKLGKKTVDESAAMTREWADAIIFVRYKTMVVATDDQGKKGKARGGQKVMHLNHTPWWHAKNRWGLLDDEYPFDYNVIRPFIPADLNEPVQSQPQPMPQQAMQTPPQNQPQMLEMLDMTQGVGSGPVINTINTPPVQQPVQQPVQNDYEGLPDALVDLMRANNVTTAMIKQTVSERGFLPADMEVKDYPMEFIDQMLIASWSQFYQVMKDTLALPF